MFGGVTETVGFPRGYGRREKVLIYPGRPRQIGLSRTCDCLIWTSSTFHWGPAPLGSAVTAAHCQLPEITDAVRFVSFQYSFCPAFLRVISIGCNGYVCVPLLQGGFCFLDSGCWSAATDRRLELCDQRVHDFPREYRTSTGPRSPPIPQPLLVGKIRLLESTNRGNDVID